MPFLNDPNLINVQNLAQWGQSQVTGRGLLALSGSGQIFSIELQPGERYVAHPSNIVAYSLSRTLPRPYRFRSTALRFQIPKVDPSRFSPDSKFLRTMQETATWKFITSTLFQLRTWTRRTIWGDRVSMLSASFHTLISDECEIIAIPPIRRTNYPSHPISRRPAQRRPYHP